MILSLIEFHSIRALTAHRYTFSLSLVVIISSWVDYGVSFCKLHCSLPSPVRFTDARDVYTFPLLIFCYLCDLATFVKVGTFQLPTFRVRLGRISGLVSPGAPGSVLLDLAPVCHCIPLTSHGHSDSLIQWILSASGFCNIFFFLRERVISPQPNPQPGPGDHSLFGSYPLPFLAWVALPGVHDSRQHSCRGHWNTQATSPRCDKVFISSEVDEDLG